jgi:hypothetical protein
MKHQAVATMPKLNTRQCTMAMHRIDHQGMHFYIFVIPLVTGRQG